MRALLVALLMSFAGFANARDAAPAAEDPALEARLMRLSNELRCLVCQNQSLADSHADLAVDLRDEVREQMRAGKTDAQIKTWLTERYGDFVLYRPPVKSSTWLLWLGPFVLFAGGLVTLLLYLRARRARVGSATELSAADHARAQALLATDSSQDPS